VFTLGSGDGATAQRVARLVAEGWMPQAAVTAAERLWSARLANGVQMPNGETARIEPDDLYHLIVDERIWRKPERIERVLAGVIAIHEAASGRRRAFSRWDEDGTTLLGYAILEPNSRVRTMHLLDAKRFERRRRKARLLWTL
jgi:hypothetical protein